MLLNIAVNFFSSSNKVLVLSRRPEAGFFPGQSPANSSHHLSAQSGSWAVSSACSPASSGCRETLGSGIRAPEVSPPTPAPEALLFSLNLSVFIWLMGVTVSTSQMERRLQGAKGGKSSTWETQQMHLCFWSFLLPLPLPSLPSSFLSLLPALFCIFLTPSSLLP